MKGVLKNIGKKYVLAIVLVISGCQQSTEKPDKVLSHDQMVQVLAEVYITEEKISHMGLTSDSAAIVFSRIQNRVFESTGVTDSVFKQSLNYYMTRPKELEQIYSVLIDSLQLREQRISAQ